MATAYDWICLEVLGVVLLVTAALVIAYKLWEKYSGIFFEEVEAGFGEWIILTGIN